VTPACTACELHAESTFKIEGMDCREEVAVLERRFKNLAGLERFSADLMGQRLHVQYDAARLSTAGIADAVADTGMRAWLEHEEPVVGSERSQRARQALVWAAGIALTLGLALQSVGPPEGGPHVQTAILLFVLSLAAGASVTLRKAWAAIRVGALDINHNSEIYWSLTDRKIPVEYVVYPREGHGIAEPAHQRDLMERNLRWFSRWLK
jgi:Cd2+/Zn2+-exporting ATPase